MARKSTTTGDIVKLKVTLTGIRPPVWRRLLLPAGMTLGDLHDAIQSSMGWEDAHLHDFDIDGRRYGDPTTIDEVINEERLTLAGIHRTGIERFTYTYDFGDDWVHLITIEGTIPDRGHDPRRRRATLPRVHRRQTILPAGGLRRTVRLCPLPRGEKRSGPPRSYGNVELGGRGLRPRRVFRHGGRCVRCGPLPRGTRSSLTIAPRRAANYRGGTMLRGVCPAGVGSGDGAGAPGAPCRTIPPPW